jgi:heat-inducible transcriptional repressor
MEQLGDTQISERQRTILGIIVEEYVATARPVGSEHIVSHYDLKVSSATVRNDMAELERAGLILQPHTSAGRVPSERGYRYFVENLMKPTALSPEEERRIRHQFHQVEMDAEEWVRLAAAVLAHSVRVAGMATPPRSVAVRLKHFELLALSESRVLVVLVGHDGTVTQQMINIEEGWDQAKLSALSARLNVALEGKTAYDIQQWASSEANVKPLGEGQLPAKVLSTLAAMLSKLERPEASHIYHEGLTHILEQPEFREEPERLQQVLELLEHGTLWNLIPSVLSREGVQVIIGSEGQPDARGIEACSVIIARYGLGNQLTGVLGVVGPTRMPYSRSISTVSYMSQLLSDLLLQAYTSNPDDGRA